MSSCLAPRRPLAAAIRASLLVACALLACAVTTLPAAASAPPILAPPCRLAGLSLDRVPALLTGDEKPELRVAQGAIERDLGVNSPATEPDFGAAEASGWKSVRRAGALSLALPGTGQLYSGSKRGYVYLGVEAVALLSYATFQAKSDDKREEYFAFVGDPNDGASRFSFERLGTNVSSAEVARLRQAYEDNPTEFYQTVTAQSQYAAGWQDPNVRTDAEAIVAEADRQDGRSRVSLYTLIANHLVSAADALNLARLSNIALRDNLSLKLKLRPGGHRSSYAFTLTQKF